MVVIKMGVDFENLTKMGSLAPPDPKNGLKIRTEGGRLLQDPIGDVNMLVLFGPWGTVLFIPLALQLENPW